MLTLWKIYLPVWLYKFESFLDFVFFHALKEPQPHYSGPEEIICTVNQT